MLPCVRALRNSLCERYSDGDECRHCHRLIQEHLETVLGNQPVEVSLDSKQVCVRPYAVSKGSVIDPLMEACTEYSRSKSDEGRDERESNSSAPVVRSTSPTELSATVAAAATAVESSADAAVSVTYAKPRLSDTPLGNHNRHAGCSAEPSEAGQSSLDFVLSIGSWSMRDEDIFANLLCKDENDVPYASELPEQTWTCRVGEAASQARHYVEDERGAFADRRWWRVFGWGGLSTRMSSPSPRSACRSNAPVLTALRSQKCTRCLPRSRQSRRPTCGHHLSRVSSVRFTAMNAARRCVAMRVMPYEASPSLRLSIISRRSRSALFVFVARIRPRMGQPLHQLAHRTTRSTPLSHRRCHRL